MPNFNGAPKSYEIDAQSEQGNSAASAPAKINGHPYKGSFVAWDAVRAATRGRELEIARHLAGVECNERQHVRCPLSAHPDIHPSFRAMDSHDGSKRFICSANCPVFHRPSNIFDLLAAVKCISAEEAKNEISAPTTTSASLSA